MKTRYAVVVEPSGSSYGVSSPDVPGCIAVAETHDDALAQFRDALAFHLEGLRADGDPIPEPRATVHYVEVEMPEPVPAG